MTVRSDPPELEPGSFCPDCGLRLSPPEDGRLRPSCGRCGFVRYRNPAVGVAVVVRDLGGRVLMGRRARGAYRGLWCIPCGFVEWDEHVREAAARELLEEVGLEVEVGPVLAVHSNFHQPEKQTVGIWFAAGRVVGEPHAADGEFDEISFFDPATPPALAFPTDALVLRQLADAESGPSPSLGPLISLAWRTAREAGAFLTERLWKERMNVSTKSTPVDMVTEVDHASERLILQRIASERPQDGFLAEEGSFRQGESGVRWVIDPLDGTTNYLYRLPAFAVSIAAEIDGRVEVGVVHDVSANETFWAVRGHGAYRNTVPIRVSDRHELQTALLGTGFSYQAAIRRRQAERLSRVLPQVRDIRRSGSAALDLCSVACGRIDGYFEEGLNPWDYAAGGLITEEAGGVFELQPQGLVLASGRSIFHHLRLLVAE